MHRPLAALAGTLALLAAPGHAASPPIDPIFADDFDSCAGDPNCWQTVKPAQHDPAWFDARCNDGSPAAYEWRPSPTRRARPGAVA